LASRMYISRVRLENIRGFSGRRNVDLTLTRPDGSHAGWTVLAGRNGSGKSSLLRAIALTIGGPFFAPNLIPDLRTWMTVGTQRSWAALQLVTAPEDFQPANGERARELEIRMAWIVDRDREISRPGSQPGLSGSVLTNTHGVEVSEDRAKSPWQTDPIGWFCAAYGPFRRLVGGSLEAQQLMSTPGPVARMASLFREDAALTEGVQWLIDKHLRAFEGASWADELKMAAMQLLADGLLPGDYEIADITSDGLWVTSSGQRLPLRGMSDGYRGVAALVVDLIKQFHDCYGGLSFEVRDGVPVITAPGVVIIDEVDAHLHVTWQQRIGGWLKAHFPNVQFIVATHSPYICQAADPGGLIRLPGPGEPKPPQVADPALYQRVVYGSGDDAVLSELFGLESPYSDQAEKLRQELVLLEAKVVSGRASEAEIADYQELRRQLTSSPTARADEVAARLRLPHESDR
jgi:AAA domain, putative AbiEii toxin, Type IV TA system/AAA domain